MYIRICICVFCIFTYDHLRWILRSLNCYHEKQLTNKYWFIYLLIWNSDSRVCVGGGQMQAYDKNAFIRLPPIKKSKLLAVLVNITHTKKNFKSIFCRQYHFEMNVSFVGFIGAKFIRQTEKRYRSERNHYQIMNSFSSTFRCSIFKMALLKIWRALR